LIESIGPGNARDVPVLATRASVAVLAAADRHRVAVADNHRGRLLVFWVSVEGMRRGGEGVEECATRDDSPSSKANLFRK
jgi:hypothetical protein